MTGHDDILQYLNGMTTTDDLHKILEFVSSVSRTSEKVQTDIAVLLHALHKNKAHEKLGYNSFYSMLSENNVTYSQRTITMLVRAGWVMDVAAREKFESDFSAYSVAKLEMVATPVETFLQGGQPEEARRFLLMARQIDRGGVSRSDIRKAMIEAGIVQPKPKRYLVYIYTPNRTELAFVETAEDPATAPAHARVIVEIKKPHRTYELKTYQSFACEG